MRIRGGRRSLGQGRGWTVGDAFWLLVPVLSVAGVIGFFAASVMLGASPPFAVVDGQSMRPTYGPGDLVVVKGVAAQDVKVGDVISIRLPEEVREEKGLPEEIVHRVVKRTGTAPDVTFVTKGDNNPGKDAFLVRPGDIRGEVVDSVPGLGYPVLFFRAEQGRIFLGALGLALVGYFVIAAIERRQEAAELESPKQAVEDLGLEVQRLREVVTSGTSPAGFDQAELERLLEEHEQDRETIQVLVGAVNEYGEHLRSHTQAVRDMATAAQEMAAAAARIQDALGTSPASSGDSTEPE